MVWGTSITATGIILTSLTFLLIEQYAVVAVIGFSLYGFGLGFNATPATAAAMSRVSSDKAGAAVGLYKMASSLGSAFGVAISAAIYTAAQHIPPSWSPRSSGVVKTTWRCDSAADTIRAGWTLSTVSTQGY